LNRPFDDQTYERIYFETQSFLILLKHIDEAKIQIIDSFAIEYEISKIPDIEREIKIREYLNSASEFIDLIPEIEQRAIELEKLGFRGIDAFHVAVAEYAKVDYFVTCDDDILKSAEKHSGKIKVNVISISKLIPEIIKDA